MAVKLPTRTVTLPTIESERLYSPAELAREIRNFHLEEEGALRSVRGPVPYEFNPATGAYPAEYGRMYGIYHAKLGYADMLVLRTGNRLMYHRGWNRDWATLLSTCNDEDRQEFPDCFTEMNNRIIWSNGINSPQVIDADARIYRLGYATRPTAPSVYGPQQPDVVNEEPPNWAGYSHPGNIGTIASDMNGQDGNITDSAHLYAVQWEADDGNLSPLSAPSEPVSLWVEGIREALITFNDHDELDDLTRAFMVRALPAGPAHTAAVLLYRTLDVKHQERIFYLRTRIAGNLDTPFYDGMSDGVLAASTSPLDLVEVPTYKVATVWNGRHVIANTGANPGLLMVSEPGRAGTFRRDRWCIPDPNGSAVTGVAVYEGKLIAFTVGSTYLIEDNPSVGLFPQELSKTVGCVAPASVKGLPDGGLIWLGREGFYRLSGGEVSLVSKEKDEDVARINWARVGRSVAVYDNVKGIYICFTPRDADVGNGEGFVYDPYSDGFRTLRFDIQMAAMCVTQDDRHYVIGAGRDENLGTTNVFVFDHESRTYTPPSRLNYYKTGELRADPTGRLRFTLDAIYVGFVESEAVAQATLRWYRNGRYSSEQSTTFDLKTDDYQASWAIGGMVLGTDQLRDPILMWRRIPLVEQNIMSFSFSIETDSTVQLCIAAYAFDVTVTDESGARVPGRLQAAA